MVLSKEQEQTRYTSHFSLSVSIQEVQLANSVATDS
jgi:hypothetical protein